MKVLFVLGARSEFGYILPVYREVERRGHHPAIWSCNTASLPGFGGVAQSAQSQGLNIRQIVTTSFDGYSHVAMAKSVGAVTQSFADFLGNESFDWVVLSGDRAEQLGAAVASTYMYVPTAHIQAGERSGNIDGVARHAIGRLAHVHFAANTDAMQRLIRAGEEPWRVVLSGAPQLDGLVESATPRSLLEEKRLVPRGSYVLSVFHPETANLSAEIEILERLLEFLADFELPIVWISPNNDAGATSVRDRVLGSLRAKDYFHENIERPDFAGVLASSELIVGNSSAGISEAPSFSKVAINLGRRQDSRFQGSNVINFPGEKRDLAEAFKWAHLLGESLKSKPPESPYGDGRSAHKIVSSLERLGSHPNLTIKQLSF